MKNQAHICTLGETWFYMDKIDRTVESTVPFLIYPLGVTTQHQPFLLLSCLIVLHCSFLPHGEPLLGKDLVFGASEKSGPIQKAREP